MFYSSDAWGVLPKPLQPLKIARCLSTGKHARSKGYSRQGRKNVAEKAAQGPHHIGHLRVRLMQ